ncbi:MAG: RNase adapter RapZ [Gallionella sp.]|nr:RNase adapter RapZ [Gallionella sp.]
MQLFLISGLSGSGKSVALKVLEDSGYYCVDNLPADLLVSLVKHLQMAGYTHIAVSVDVRSANSVRLLPPLVKEIQQQGVDVRILFLDAQNATLVKRFSETRRLHPLSDPMFLEQGHVARTLPECVEYERELLSEISDIGHHIDTTETNANALRAWIKQLIKIDKARLTLLFQSFGFKHGIPLDADLVFDVRCLPNPHYEPLLRPLTGRDTSVIEFLENAPLVQEMFADITHFVERWLPHYIADNRSYLTVGIGCTGGQHRSVFLSEKLAHHFADQQQVLIRHRELAQ